MRKRAVVGAVEQVAKHLGNTPAVCRRCYTHPEIFEGYFDGTLLATLVEKTRLYLTEEIEGMSAEEAAVVAFLRLPLDSSLRKRRPRSRAALRSLLICSRSYGRELR
jgi:DNA topoisomerase-1